MKTIILDFTDTKVKILRHDPMQTEEVEDLMFEKYDLSPNNILWMTVEDLVFEDLGEEKVQKTVFTISKDEIEEFAERKLSENELTEALSFIENDECVWNAIEESKKEALMQISKN